MLDASKIYSSNNCGDFKIINYKSWNDITVEFLETGFVTKSRSPNILGGKVKDKLKPIAYGVGYFGDGSYKAKKNGKITKAYSAWFNMLERCYCPSFHKRQPTYKNCFVCDDWHNFQNFAKWFGQNYTEGLQLDKDVKQDGITNKVYSPETCIFIPHSENSSHSSAKKYKFISPSGVLIDVFNLRKFCRENNLTHSAMINIYHGKNNHHKNWRKA